MWSISVCFNTIITNLMFTGVCIVIYFYSKTNQMHHFLKFILFWNNTLHISDSLSVHNQDFKTVHTAAGICQTDNVACLQAGNIICLTYLLLYVQS